MNTLIPDSLALWLFHYHIQSHRCQGIHVAPVEDNINITSSGGQRSPAHRGSGMPQDPV